jgi:hypothetical protein
MGKINEQPRGLSTSAIMVAVGLQRSLGNWSHRLGKVAADTIIVGNQVIQETISSYREIFVSNRRGPVLGRLLGLTQAGANAQADATFMGQIPRVAYDAALVIGAIGPCRLAICHV